MIIKTHVAFATDDGIVSVLPAIKTVLQRDPAAHVILFYCTRSSEQVEALEELQDLKDRFLDRLALHFLFTDQPQDAEIFDGPLDGRKVHALAQNFFDPAHVLECLVAGPADLVRSVADALQELGVPPVRIRGDNESLQLARAVEHSEPTAPAATLDARGCTQVTLVMDGRRRSFSMPADGTSVLEAGEMAGLDLPFSCRAGVCSTCRTKVVKGAVKMAENYALEPWEVEQGYVLACQSSPTTPELELDYDDI